MELKEILIVDEQFPMLANIQRILQDWGYCGHTGSQCAVSVRRVAWPSV